MIRPGLRVLDSRGCWIRVAGGRGDDCGGGEAAGEGQRRPWGQGPVPRWHARARRRRRPHLPQGSREPPASLPVPWYVLLSLLRFLCLPVRLDSNSSFRRSRSFNNSNLHDFSQNKVRKEL